jgi:hypothetical protein
MAVPRKKWVEKGGHFLSRRRLFRHQIVNTPHVYIKSGLQGIFFVKIVYRPCLGVFVQPRAVSDMSH